MIKIDVISGFLGAGKTTLIQKLLKEAFQEEQVVLIENEFGEIGIDGGFLKDAGVEIREMNSGCICCSLVGDFGASLKEVISAYHPDRILIEPSGVGKLSDVIKAIKSVSAEEEIVLNSTTAVVDVKKCRMYLHNFGEFYQNQIETAKTILLSRTDIADDEKIEKTVELIRTMNKTASVITTPAEKMEGKKILDIMEQTAPSLEEEMLEEALCGHHGHDHEHEDCGCGHHGHDHEHGDCGCGHHGHGHHHADEVFASWGTETVRKFNAEELKVRLEALQSSAVYGEVLRAKGMVEGDRGSWIYFDMVPGEIEVREGQPEYTGRICVIGAGLKESALRELFG